MQIEFTSLPKNLEELKSSPYATLEKPEYTAALAIASLLVYEDEPEECHRMLDFLKGPEPLNPYQKQFLKDRFMDNKSYVVKSYFSGTSPENNYTVSLPACIEVDENPYSYGNEHWAKLWLTSSGADNPRPIDLREKPSTGQWFLAGDFGFLAGIRPAVQDDAWA